MNFVNINIVPQNLVSGVRYDFSSAEHSVEARGSRDFLQRPNTFCRPHTPPNNAGFTARTELETPGQPFQITSTYTESPISYFQALSWRYGCVLGTDESAAAVTTPCTITATGIAPGGKQLAQQTFKFTPNGALLQDLNLGTFNSKFNGLEKLVFQVTNNLTTVVLMDDFVANVFQNTANVIR